MSPKQHLLDLSLHQLEADLTRLGEPTYRARQILDWVFERQVTDFATMTDLPAALRERLDDTFSILVAQELDRAVAPDGTTKILLQWPDGATTETVMIPSQGPPLRGPELGSGEPSASAHRSGVMWAAASAPAESAERSATSPSERSSSKPSALPSSSMSRRDRLSHVVFMGMGEPLANYDVTVAAVRHLNAAWGLGSSPAAHHCQHRRPAQPRSSSSLGKDFRSTLALSLHAPNEELRRDLIPWAKGVPLASLLEACETYFRSHRP